MNYFYLVFLKDCHHICVQTVRAYDYIFQGRVTVSTMLASKTKIKAGGDFSSDNFIFDIFVVLMVEPKKSSL